MGFFEDLLNAPFDLNGDGKVSFDEEWDAMNMLKSCIKKEEASKSTFLYDNKKSHYSDNVPEIVQAEQKQCSYPNKRMQEAAERLADLKNNTAFLSDGKTIEGEIERCEFILSSSVIAARYLTVYDGFVLGQALKENFHVPVNIPDEDTQSQVYFPTLFMNIAEEDVNLAVDIWVWCIKEFGPYKKYLEYDDNFYGSIVSSMDDYPETFIDVATKKLGSDAEFRKGLLIDSPEVLYSSQRFVIRALELNLIKEAQDIFKSISMNSLVKGKPMEDIINQMKSSCSDWQNLEMIESIKLNIMPIVEKLDDKRIQRLFPRFMKEIDGYINYVEKSSEKYRFSRRYEWRNHCADGSQYNIDPLDYETEEEYNDAVHERKYAWRKWRRNNRFGINVDLFETETDYLNAEKIKIQESLRTKKTEYEATEKIPRELSAEDKKVYKFCAVVFNGMNKPYSYLTGDLDVKVGDKVVVSIGDSQQERVATVVSVSECMKCVAPYPVDKAKTIIKICED